MEYFHVTAKESITSAEHRATNIITPKGTAPLVDRTWNTTAEFGGGWVGPLCRLTGGPGNGPCFDFDSNSGIKNFNGFDTPALGGAVTYFVVAKVRMFNPSSVTTNYLLASGAGSKLTVRPSLVNGTRRLTISTTTIEANLPVDDAFDAGRFSTLIFVLDGSSSRIKIGNYPVIALPLEPHIYRGLIVGRWYLNRESGPGFDGLISEWGMFNRALDQTEMNNLFVSLSKNLN
ncbi:hypothetical protein FZC33_21615 [Labrys sp. KNU-23]|uniref:hypothetical protein n=1 Tax=Labrys sp. KNU-23 TaxID=2789216 RepID=UPI0011EC07BB|nr:hypothetical protein [Labrys sp. KNU-23]QEN88738.1 hypothetical protein FZC33_21615 [Labrys sp. KNU-23]